MPPNAPSLLGFRVWRTVVLASVFVLPLGGCAGARGSGESGPAGSYRTAFPAPHASPELERTFRSVKQVAHQSEYRVFHFGEVGGLNDDDLTQATNLSELWALAESRAERQSNDIQTKGGTATLLSVARGRMLFLTALHVVTSPELRIQYRDEFTEGGPSPRLASLAFRTSETGGLLAHPDLGAFALLASDEANDLALFEMDLPFWVDPTQFPALRAPPGDARRLGWGAFVYAMGYPSSYPMLTGGIVSDPNRDSEGGFLTDGMWNEGISGGLIFAIRGDSGALEWVGMARAGAARWENRLVPDAQAIPRSSGATRRYEGPLWIESALRIQYGITLPIPGPILLDFLARHRAELRARGYSVP